MNPFVDETVSTSEGNAPQKLNSLKVLGAFEEFIDI
jgi:hypothetical protein